MGAKEIQHGPHRAVYLRTLDFLFNVASDFCLNLLKEETVKSNVSAQ